VNEIFICKEVASVRTLESVTRRINKRYTYEGNKMSRIVRHSFRLEELPQFLLPDMLLRPYIPVQAQRVAEYWTRNRFESKKNLTDCFCFFFLFLLCVLYDPDDEGDKSLQNVYMSPNYTASQARRFYSS
jgi:hypothetical protein